MEDSKIDWPKIMEGITLDWSDHTPKFARLHGGFVFYTWYPGREGKKAHWRTSYGASKSLPKFEEKHGKAIEVTIPVTGYIPIPK